MTFQRCRTAGAPLHREFRQITPAQTQTGQRLGRFPFVPALFHPTLELVATFGGVLPDAVSEKGSRRGRCYQLTMTDGRGGPGVLSAWTDRKAGVRRYRSPFYTGVGVHNRNGNRAS